MDQKEVLKIMSFGVFDYEFSINLSKSELKEMDIKIPEINSLKDIYKYLRIEKFRNKVEIKSKNNLINLLLFLNISNTIKTPIEFFSLNSLFLPKEMHLFNNKIRNNFIINNLYILESNILPPSRYNFSINAEGYEKKVFVEDYSNKINQETNKESKKIVEEKIVLNTNLDTKKAEKMEINNAEKNKKVLKHQKTEFDKDNGNTYVHKSEDKKIDEIVKSNDNIIKLEEKKIDDKIKINDKEQEHKLEDKSNDGKSNQIEDKNNNNEVSKSENINNDSNSNNVNDKSSEDPLVVTINKNDKPLENPSNLENPKGKHSNYDKEPLNLPIVEKPVNIDYKIHNDVEGKDQGINIIDPNEFKRNQESILMFTRKSHIDSLEKNNNKFKQNEQGRNYYDRINIEEQLQYNFETCDYLILDLNQFTNNQYLSLENIYNYLYINISKKYLNTMIILIFPNTENIKIDQVMILVNLVKIADVIIFDKKDAIQFSTMLGYKHEEKSFEIRLMFLNEFKTKKYKPYRIVIFIDCFNKITSIFQETETSLITFYKDFQFNIGYKKEYYNIILKHSEFLKNIIYGSFLSRIVLNYPFEICYEAAENTFKKMLENFMLNIDHVSYDPKIFVFNKREAENIHADYQIRNYGYLKSLSHYVNSSISDNSEKLETIKLKFSKKKLEKLKKSFENIDSRLSQALNNGKLVSHNLDKFLSSRDQKGKSVKPKKSRIIKIPNNEFLVGKMMNLNSVYPINSIFTNTSKKLKPINKPNSLSKGNDNPQVMMNYMNMMSQMNSLYKQNIGIQSFSTNQN